MSVALRNVGEYRGPWLDYALIEKKTDKGEFNGLSLHVKIQAAEVWMAPEGANEPAWLDCSGWDGHGEGYIVLISKAGKVNDGQIQRLIKYAGWDGDFQSMSDRTWEPKPVRFDIGEDHYQNQISYRVSWINDYESEPGGGGNVDAERAKTLNTQFGAAVRALRGNLQQKPAPAAGKPAAPSAARKSTSRSVTAQTPTNTAVPQQGGKDEIPF